MTQIIGTEDLADSRRFEGYRPAKACCVGFFAAANVVPTFDQPLMPFGQKEVGTPPAEATA